MAQVRLRPGPWKLVDDGTGALTREIQIDYEKFEVPNGGTVEFEIGQMGIYDDTYLTAYRNPVSTVVSVGNVGGVGTPMESPYFKKRKF
ncbi:MAG: hypothetical protein [Circular genetic element sp.]|nr:MAG: hypothetical protein [Circular genetic element sp.]